MSSLQKKAPLIVIVVLVVTLGAYAYSRSYVDDSRYVPTASEPAGHGIVGNAKSDTDAYDVRITYINDGFGPADITIKQGERVRFLNNSDVGIWPASGVHPTHSLYPEKEPTDCLGSSFDSCQEVKPGEFFDFTFYYTGRWTFHDHVHAYHTGSITVTQNL